MISDYGVGLNMYGSGWVGIKFSFRDWDEVSLEFIVGFTV